MKNGVNLQSGRNHIHTARFWWITPFKFQYNSYFFACHGMSTFQD